jgi:pimeloyl-ACP methyl ester carboxylesterase
VMLTIVIVIALVLAAALLAVITAIGTIVIERAHPPTGRFVDVTGGRLHLLELGPADGTPVVMLHGASANLQDMRLTLGELLAKHHRVILIDRPGHGWSDRPGGDDDASPARQAALIREVFDRLGVTRAIVVGHSFAGAVVTAFALAYPERVAGLVLLAPATHPWRGGVAWFYTLTGVPVVGPLFARTVVLPLALLLLDRVCRAVFAPQPMPESYPQRAAIPLLLRPPVFIANAKDVAQLLGSVKRQSPRYGEISSPIVLITGDRDTIVPPDTHSRPLARTLPHSKLIVLPGVGHAVQHVAADAVATEIDRLAEAAR